MAKIKIRGVITSNDWKEVYEWFGMEATCPLDVENNLEQANGEDIEVEINSGGGDVFSGSEIYTILKQYTGKIVVKILGMAASAAGVIAMAGDNVMISPTAQIMIHNVWSTAMGDYRAMEHEAVVLKGWNKSIANAYILRTGMSQSELLALMNKESWLTAQDAVKNGFADEVMFDEGAQLVAAVNTGILPPEVLNKIKNLIRNKSKEPDNPPNPPNHNQPNQASIEPPFQAAILLPEVPRPAPVDLYQKLYEDLERRSKLCI